MLIREATASELTEVAEIRVDAYVAGGFLTADSGYAPMLRALGADGTGCVLVAVEQAGGADEAGRPDPVPADHGPGRPERPGQQPEQNPGQPEQNPGRPEQPGRPGQPGQPERPGRPEGRAPGQPAADSRRIVGTIMLQVWPHVGQVVAGSHEAEIRALAVRPQAQGAGVGRALVGAAIERATRLGASYLVLSTEPEMRAAHRIYERAGFIRLPDRDWSPAPGVQLLVYGLALG